MLKLLPLELMTNFKIIPLFSMDNSLTLAMADVDNIDAIDRVTDITGMEVSPALASETAIQNVLRSLTEGDQEIRFEDSNVNISDLLDTIDSESPDEQAQAQTKELERQAEQAPVVKITNSILIQAILDGASDVHIQPEEDNVRVRYREDGILQDSLTLPKRLQSAIISRIKILSHLDIAESRVPQDGQLYLRLKDGREIDLRVSTMPSIYGESIVLRILDKSTELLRIEKLGFEEDNLESMRSLLSNAYGILLVTGPTGSGKTTTLYAALNYLSSPEKNIITLEDPVEYRFPMIRQSQVNLKTGMTFAKGLRAILRQDPDIIMVGEIRDEETATIAVQAALTGHLVLSTLHTNDAAGAVTRLTEMGVPVYLVPTALLGVQAQRLVRRICPECKETYTPPAAMIKDITSQIGVHFDREAYKLYHGTGCKNCNESGYRGRASIIEILPMTSEIQKLILLNKDASEIRAVAKRMGIRNMLHDGWLKVKNGVTTVEEVIRVVNVH